MSTIGNNGEDAVELLPVLSTPVHQNTRSVRGLDPLVSAPGADLGADWHLSEEMARQFLLGYTGSTLEAYQRDLRQFAVFCAQVDVAPIRVRRHHVDLYRHHLQSVRRLAPATVNRRLASLASWMTYCVNQEVLSRNPVHGVRRPRVDNEPTTPALTPAEVRAAFAAAQPDARLSALVHLLFFTGIRISSALDLDVGDLRTEQGYRTAPRAASAASPCCRSPLSPRCIGTSTAGTAARCSSRPLADDGTAPAPGGPYESWAQK